MGENRVENGGFSKEEEKILGKVEKEGKRFQDLALAIHAKPEVSNYEFCASEELSKRDTEPVLLPPIRVKRKDRSPFFLRSLMRWKDWDTVADTISSGQLLPLRQSL